MGVYLKDKAPLGDAVAAEVLRVFREVTRGLKSGVPRTRSNGDEEWTVLAAMVLIDSQDRLDVVALTTGVKAMPDAKLQAARGLVLHDLHAEVLALRGFNYILMREIYKIRHGCGDKSKILTEELGLMPGLKVVLYVSEPPCGDLSMSQVVQQQSGTAEAWKRSNDGELLRGRSHFGHLGKIRTKPGRQDSLVSYSKSCSDKLCSRQFYGFANSMVASLLQKDFKLDYLVLEAAKIDEADADRCLRERYNGEYAGPYIRVVPTRVEFPYAKDSSKKPSELSLVALKVDGKWETEVIGKQGLKNGRSKPDLQSCSRLSNASLVHEFRDLLPRSVRQYSDLKKLDLDRSKLKSKIRNEVLKDDWVLTFKDDFEL